MLKFILMLGLVALVASCGKQEEEVGPQGIGSRFALSDATEIETDELKTLSSLCAGLAQKESYYRSNYADKAVVFNFETQKQGCEDTRATNYKTAAHIKHVNGNMQFVKLSQAAFIFNDISLRNTGDFKEFCDMQEAKALENRYIQSGNIARLIYLKKNTTQLEVKILTAYDFDGDDEYEVESKDYYVVVNVKNEWRGVVKVRSQETKAGCSGDNVSVMSTTLTGIQN